MLGQELEVQWNTGVTTFSQRREELIFFLSHTTSWRSTDPLLGINQDDSDTYCVPLQGKGRALPRVQGSKRLRRNLYHYHCNVLSLVHYSGNGTNSSCTIFGTYSANTEKYAGGLNDCNNTTRAPGEEVGMFATVTVPHEQNMPITLGSVSPPLNLSVMH